MGTSKDYDAPRTPEWGKVKRDVSQGGKNPEPIPPPPLEPPYPEPPLPPEQELQRRQDPLPPHLPLDIRRPLEKMTKTMGRFVGAQYGGAGGGGGSSSKNARQTAQRVGKNLGRFFSSVGSSGAVAAAQQFGISNLQGMSANDIVMSLTDTLGGPGTTIDDVDARNALAKLMDERLKNLPPDEIIQSLERIPVGEEFARFIERFFAYYIFEQFNRVFYSRLEARVGKDKAAQYLKNGFHCIEWMLRDQTAQINVQGVNWAGKQGENIINSIINGVFRIFTGSDE